ncbi:MAG: ABC transporter ATP-binding protein [Gammaproteobacteria bacterium]
MIHLENLCMHYDAGAGRVDVLRGVNLEIGAGERVAVTGPSGCGKTTLLLLLAALERPVSGSIIMDGVDLGSLDSDALADLRRDRIGIVFQSFHLIPSLTALDNVALPLEIAKQRNARAQAREMLARVGLSAREHHYPSQLSGGEQQRVAITRSLVHRPALLLADEPTGNLDEHTGAMVSEVLFELIGESGTTFVLVTHDLSLVHACHRVLRLHEGALEPCARPRPESRTSSTPVVS